MGKRRSTESTSSLDSEESKKKKDPEGSKNKGKILYKDSKQFIRKMNGPYKFGMICVFLFVMVMSGFIFYVTPPYLSILVVPFFIFSSLPAFFLWSFIRSRPLILYENGIENLIGQSKFINFSEIQYVKVLWDKSNLMFIRPSTLEYPFIEIYFSKKKCKIITPYGFHFYQTENFNEVVRILNKKCGDRFTIEKGIIIPGLGA